MHDGNLQHQNHNDEEQADQTVNLQGKEIENATGQLGEVQGFDFHTQRDQQDKDEESKHDLVSQQMPLAASRAQIEQVFGGKIINRGGPQAVEEQAMDFAPAVSHGEDDDDDKRTDMNEADQFGTDSIDFATPCLSMDFKAGETITEYKTSTRGDPHRQPLD